MSAPNTVTWDLAKLARLKKAMAAAPKDTFTFEGNEYLKAYARYLIEYLEGVLHEPKAS